jgi:hypothetical protein
MLGAMPSKCPEIFVAAQYFLRERINHRMLTTLLLSITNNTVVFHPNLTLTPEF